MIWMPTENRWIAHSGRTTLSTRMYSIRITEPVEQEFEDCRGKDQAEHGTAHQVLWP